MRAWRASPWANVLNARGAPAKKRGKGKQKQHAASAIQASNSLRTFLPAIIRAARAPTLLGTVDGHQGASHNSALLIFVCERPHSTAARQEGWEHMRLRYEGRETEIALQYCQTLVEG